MNINLLEEAVRSALKKRGTFKTSGQPKNPNLCHFRINYDINLNTLDKSSFLCPFLIRHFYQFLIVPQKECGDFFPILHLIKIIL